MGLIFFIFFHFFLLSFIIIYVQGSFGDRLTYFRHCLTNCLVLNCSNNEKIAKFERNQALLLKLFNWDCDDECKYYCQWSTVDYLLDNGIQAENLPQFYGKWTFVRLFGIQEPASALFSLFNLLSTYYAWIKYVRKTHVIFSPRNRQVKSIDPYFIHITFNALLSMNAWLWSMLFHIHETPFTEKMDYFSAYSVILSSLYNIVVKIIDEKLKMVNRNRYILHISLFIAFLSFYIYHIYYLLFIHFDYGYNMKVNLATGIFSSLLWLVWSYERCSESKESFSDNHVRKCIFAVIFLNILLLFELNDFPPMYFTIDAHSLWHFGTIFIPFIWFSFLEEEAFHYKYKKISSILTTDKLYNTSLEKN